MTEYAQPVWDGTGVPPSSQPPPDGDGYDPGEHTVAEVLEHLATLDDPDEYDRVVAAERAGKARSTLLDNLPDRPTPAEE